MHTVTKKILLLALFLLTQLAFAQPAAIVEKDRLDAGDKFLALGEVEKAIAEYDLVIRFNPRNAQAFGMRGYAKMLNRDTDGAIADYTAAIKFSPNVPGIETAYNNRGTAYQYRGDHINAFNDFAKAISINPKYASPYNGRAVIFESRGKINEALADFNKAILLNPALTPAYAGRGDIRFQKGELDLAFADYDKAAKLDPAGASIHLWRGILQGVRNRWEQSVDDLKTAFRLQKIADPLLGGSLTPAFLDLDKYMVARQKNARLFAARGFINLLRKKDAEAEKDFKRAFTLEPALKKTLEEFITHVRETRD
jgi:tetratricopeptide (TPR) repeat protein